jgi:hypothetical protein
MVGAGVLRVVTYLPPKELRMTRRTPLTLLGAAAVPLVALAVAGCGGGGSATAKAPPPAAHGSAMSGKPAAKKPAAADNGIPQNNGGDHDADNNGGPSDGDGGI